MKVQINGMVNSIHGNNVVAGWYTDLKYQEKFDRVMGTLGNYPNTALTLLTDLGIKEHGVFNVGEKLALIHSEISEAMEGHRKNLMDDKLPHRKMIEVELADAMIRIMDLAGALKLDLGGAMEEKLNYNSNRADHKIENRLKENGKAY